MYDLVILMNDSNTNRKDLLDKLADKDISIDGGKADILERLAAQHAAGGSYISGFKLESDSFNLSPDFTSFGDGIQIHACFSREGDGDLSVKGLTFRHSIQRAKLSEDGAV